MFLPKHLLRPQYTQEKQPRIKTIKRAQLIHRTALGCQAGRWRESSPCQLSPEIKFNQKNPQNLGHGGAPSRHQITQTEQRLLPMFLHKGGGKSSFWKAAVPHLLPAAPSCLHPLPCCGSERKEIKQESVTCWLCRTGTHCVRASWEQR